MAKKCTKKRDVRANLFFLLNKTIVVLTFLLPSLSLLLKLPSESAILLTKLLIVSFKVRVTPDLGYATIYWAVLGESTGDVETVQSLLDENTNYIR